MYTSKAGCDAVNTAYAGQNSCWKIINNQCQQTTVQGLCSANGAFISPSVCDAEKNRLQEARLATAQRQAVAESGRAEAERQMIEHIKDNEQTASDAKRLEAYAQAQKQEEERREAERLEAALLEAKRLQEELLSRTKTCYNQMYDCQPFSRIFNSPTDTCESAGYFTLKQQCKNPGISGADEQTEPVDPFKIICSEDNKNGGITYMTSNFPEKTLTCRDADGCVCYSQFSIKCGETCPPPSEEIAEDPNSDTPDANESRDDLIDDFIDQNEIHSATPSPGRSAGQPTDQPNKTCANYGSFQYTNQIDGSVPCDFNGEIRYACPSGWPIDSDTQACPTPAKVAEWIEEYNFETEPAEKSSILPTVINFLNKLINRGQSEAEKQMTAVHQAIQFLPPCPDNRVLYSAIPGGIACQTLNDQGSISVKHYCYEGAKTIKLASGTQHCFYNPDGSLYQSSAKNESADSNFGDAGTATSIEEESDEQLILQTLPNCPEGYYSTSPVEKGNLCKINKAEGLLEQGYWCPDSGFIYATPEGHKSCEPVEVSKNTSATPKITPRPANSLLPTSSPKTSISPNPSGNPASSSPNPSGSAAIKSSSTPSGSPRPSVSPGLHLSIPNPTSSPGTILSSPNPSPNLNSSPRPSATPIFGDAGEATATTETTGCAQYTDSFSCMVSQPDVCHWNITNNSCVELSKACRNQRDENSCNNLSDCAWHNEACWTSKDLTLAKRLQENIKAGICKLPWLNCSDESVTPGQCSTENPHGSCPESDQACFGQYINGVGTVFSCEEVDIPDEEKSKSPETQPNSPPTSASDEEDIYLNQEEITSPLKDAIDKKQAAQELFIQSLPACPIGYYSATPIHKSKLCRFSNSDGSLEQGYYCSGSSLTYPTADGGKSCEQPITPEAPPSSNIGLKNILKQVGLNSTTIKTIPLKVEEYYNNLPDCPTADYSFFPMPVVGGQACKLNISDSQMSIKYYCQGDTYNVLNESTGQISCSPPVTDSPAIDQSSHPDIVSCQNTGKSFTDKELIGSAKCTHQDGNTYFYCPESTEPFESDNICETPEAHQERVNQRELSLADQTGDYSYFDDPWDQVVGVVGPIAEGIFYSPFMPGALLNASEVAVEGGGVVNSLGTYFSGNFENFSIRKSAVSYALNEASNFQEIAAAVSIAVLPSIGTTYNECAEEISWSCATSYATTVLEGADISFLTSGLVKNTYKGFSFIRNRGTSTVSVDDAISNLPEVRVFDPNRRLTVVSGEFVDYEDWLINKLASGEKLPISPIRSSGQPLVPMSVADDFVEIADDGLPLSPFNPDPIEQVQRINLDEMFPKGIGQAIDTGDGSIAVLERIDGGDIVQHVISPDFPNTLYPLENGHFIWVEKSSQGNIQLIIDQTGYPVQFIKEGNQVIKVPSPDMQTTITTETIK